MNNFSSKPPKSNNSTPRALKKFFQLFDQGVEKLQELEKQQQEQEIQRIAKAKFPWNSIVSLFILYGVFGFLLACLPGSWQVIGFIIIIVLSLLILIQAFGQPEIIFDNLFLDLTVTVLAELLVSIKRKLKDVFKRRFLKTPKKSGEINWQQELLPLFCFILMASVEGLGLWVGHFIKTQVL